jgi:hypothetical protein
VGLWIGGARETSEVEVRQSRVETPGDSLQIRGHLGRAEVGYAGVNC